MEKGMGLLALVHGWLTEAGAQGEGTRELSTCGKEVEKVSLESSRHRELGGEGFFTSSMDALPGPLTTKKSGNDCD